MKKEFPYLIKQWRQQLPNIGGSPRKVYKHYRLVATRGSNRSGEVADFRLEIKGQDSLGERIWKRHSLPEKEMDLHLLNVMLGLYDEEDEEEEKKLGDRFCGS